MQNIASLLNPRSIAVVGASQNRGRGGRVLINLRELGFAGAVFAVHPKFDEVHGYPCFPNVSSLPLTVDCVVAAVSADVACEVLEESSNRGIPAAVVLAAGFGEGGHGGARVARLKSLAEKGMAICGPNCFGALNVISGAAAYSGNLPKPLRKGSVALVSQSGGLGANVFFPLMSDRRLGFSHVISCGNQLGVSVEEYIEDLVRDPHVSVVAAIVESLRRPQKLLEIAQYACAKRKTIVFFHAGRSAAGKLLTQSHTGALTSNATIFAAHLRRCGLIQVDTYEQFVEVVELFAVAPNDHELGPDIIVISGSGGGAAVAADSLDDTGLSLPELSSQTQQRIAAAMPEFGSVTNPVDGTGAMSDDPALLPKLYDAILGDESRAIIATSLSAWPAGNRNGLRFATTLAESARSSDRTIVAYQPTHLGGPLDENIVETLHSARVPLLLGVSTSMKALKYLPLRTLYRKRVPHARVFDIDKAPPSRELDWHLQPTIERLRAAGLSIAHATPASSAEEAVAAFEEFATAVAIKADVDGLLHKTDIGAVALNCKSVDEVVIAYKQVTASLSDAGYLDVKRVIVQPMQRGLLEVYAGIICDPVFGPAVTFGLGGIFVEIFKDTTTEMAPISGSDAFAMIHRIKAAPLLIGARGRPSCDIDALSTFLVRLGEFATEHYGEILSLDLNPIIVGAPGEGVVAVDIAVEPLATKQDLGNVSFGPN